MGLAIAIFIWLAALQIGTAGKPHIFDELSGQYAGTAWEMVQTGDWLVPSLQGIPRLKKPPLAYWFTAASLTVFGRNEFGARLPTALVLMGVIGMTALLGRRLYGEGRGLMAALILGTFLGLTLLGKTVMPELYVTLGVAVSLYAAVRAVEAPEASRRWALLFWSAVAFATMAKGLPGTVFPPAVVVALALFRPELRWSLLRLAYPPAILLFLALTLPWPLYIESRFPGFIHDNLFNEHVGHVLDTHYPHDTVATPVGLFWAQHLGWWFPWVLFLPAAILARREAPSTHRMASLPVAWAGVIALVLSAAGQRQDYYSMPLWPAAALLMASLWDLRPERGKERLSVLLPLLFLAGIGAVGLAAYGVGSEALNVGSDTTGSFASRNNMAGSLTQFSSEVWKQLWPILGIASLSLFLGSALGAAALFLPRFRQWWWLPAAAGLTGLLAGSLVGLDHLSPYFGLKSLGQALTREATPETLVVYDGPSGRGSSLRFYSDVPVRWLERPETEFAVRSRGIGKDRFVSEEQVVERWRSGEPIALMMEEERLAHWRERLGEPLPDPAARSGTRILLLHGQ